MTDKEIEQKMQKLIQIGNNKGLQQQKQDLETLRKEIGASRAKEHKRGDDFTVGELIDNCHNALQTETMIDVCKTAARNFWITILAALAAWAAVVVMALTK